MQRGRGILFMNTLLDVLVGDELWRLDRDDILASYIISRTFFKLYQNINFPLIRTQFNPPLGYQDFATYILDECSSFVQDIWFVRRFSWETAGLRFCTRLQQLFFGRLSVIWGYKVIQVLQQSRDSILNGGLASALMSRASLRPAPAALPIYISMCWYCASWQCSL